MCNLPDTPVTGEAEPLTASVALTVVPLPAMSGTSEFAVVCMA